MERIRQLESVVNQVQTGEHFIDGLLFQTEVNLKPRKLCKCMISWNVIKEKKEDPRSIKSI